MKQWLYHKSNAEGKLFDGEAAIEAAIKSGEWEDTPAKCGGSHSCEGPGIGEVAIEDYKGLTVGDFKSRFTVKELRVIAKELNIKVTRQNTEDEIAHILVDALTKEGE